jgi:hypothetical protein
MEKVQKHIVREAIRSALLPTRNALKAKIMSLPNIRDQSSGATARALTSKYSNSKSNPFRFYGIIGVDNKHIEAISPEPSPMYASALQRQVAFGVKRRLRNGRITLSRRNQRREVRSSLNKYVTKLRKRWPARYLHLWEYGFTHRNRITRFKGRNYFSLVRKETESEARAIFTQKVLHHFKKAMS